MRIGIDLDGVVFNTEMLWATFAELYDCLELKRNSMVNKNATKVQDKYDWTDEELNCFLDKYIDVYEFDLVPGAKEILELLKQEGNELIIITARGTLANSKSEIKIAEDKLLKENIKYDKVYWGQKNKVEICKQEKIDVMIDDNYEICKMLSNSNVKSLYFYSLGRKHILDDSNIVEVYNWGEIYKNIKLITNNKL